MGKGLDGETRPGMTGEPGPKAADKVEVRWSDPAGFSQGMVCGSIDQKKSAAGRDEYQPPFAQGAL